MVALALAASAASALTCHNKAFTPKTVKVFGKTKTVCAPTAQGAKPTTKCVNRKGIVGNIKPGTNPKTGKPYTTCVYPKVKPAVKCVSKTGQIGHVKPGTNPKTGKPYTICVYPTAKPAPKCVNKAGVVGNIKPGIDPKTGKPYTVCVYLKATTTKPVKNP